ncbi:MAG: hypothetical protein Fur0022_19570 [Anaerolineales bacterium]
MRSNLSFKPLNWPIYPDDGRSCLLKPEQGAIGYNLILSGRAGDLEQIVQHESIRHRLQELVDTIRPVSLLQGQRHEWQAVLHGFGDIEIRLYNLEQDTTEREVWQIIKTIYTLAAQQGVVVFADPNFLTAAPNSAGGGSGGTTGGPLEKLGRAAQEDDYIRDWAIASNGVNLEDGLGTRLVSNVTGTEVPVFIFDSCDRRLGADLNLIPPQKGAEAQPNYYEIWRNYPPSPLKLHISSPASRFHQENKNRRPVRIEASNDPNKDVDEHGLFVSSIIHRVAPNSQLHLVDVLNREGRGEIYGLIRALFLLAEQAVLGEEPSSQPPLEGVVVNLSLGTSLSEAYMTSIKFQDLLQDLRASAYRKNAQNHVLLTILDDMVGHHYYVGALRLVIRLLYELGAVLVAAAGNDSAQVPGVHLKQIPATYPEVIAVAASTFTRTKANFSNLGDILAPGGGTAAPDVVSPYYNREAEPLEVYQKQNVTGIVLKLRQDQSGYAYWLGTSFSAPFVTGLVALMIEKLKQEKQALHPYHIRTLVLKHSPEGIINIPAILAQL